MARPKGARAIFTVRKADLPAIRKFIETTPVDIVAPSMRRAIERHMPDLVNRLPPEGNPPNAKPKRR